MKETIDVERTFGALVLAGGSARRMEGRNKALLELDRRTFLSYLEEALGDFEEKLLSTRDPVLAEGTGFLPIPDRTAGLGPLEGLRQALTVCRSDALVVSACDTPLFSAELARFLVRSLGESDLLVCRDRQGGVHPLCGVYTKNCLPAIESLLSSGERRVRRVLDLVPATVLSLADTPFPDRLLFNVNTPQELETLLNIKELT